jgi:hypothetical protein
MRTENKALAKSKQGRSTFNGKSPSYHQVTQSTNTIGIGLAPRLAKTKKKEPEFG